MYSVEARARFSTPCDGRQDNSVLVPGRQRLTRNLGQREVLACRSFCSRSSSEVRVFP